MDGGWRMEDGGRHAAAQRVHGFLQVDWRGRGWPCMHAIAVVVVEGGEVWRRVEGCRRAVSHRR